MDRAVTGFTLIEVLVVLAILGVLLGLAVPSYTHWRMERQLTADTQKVLSFVQKERARAYSTKQNLTLNVDGSKTICDNIGNCVHTQNAFQGSPSSLTISSRGVYDNGSIWIENTDRIDQYEPVSSCVVLTSTRARIGKYDVSNSTCEAQ